MCYVCDVCVMCCMTYKTAICEALRFPNNFWKNISARGCFSGVLCEFVHAIIEFKRTHVWEPTALHPIIGIHEKSTLQTEIKDVSSVFARSTASDDNDRPRPRNSLMVLNMSLT